MALDVVEVFEVGRWRLHIDVTATRELYAKRASGAAELCQGRGCTSCANYALARDRLAPELLALLDRMGADFRKEDHAAHSSFLGPGRMSYWAVFSLVGEIVAGADSHTPVPGRERAWRIRYEPFAPGVTLGFTTIRFGRSRVENATLWIEFNAELPWLLEGTGFAAAVLVHGRDMPPPPGEKP